MFLFQSFIYIKVEFWRTETIIIRFALRNKMYTKLDTRHTFFLIKWNSHLSQTGKMKKIEAFIEASNVLSGIKFDASSQQETFGITQPKYKKKQIQFATLFSAVGRILNKMKTWLVVKSSRSNFQMQKRSRNEMKINHWRSHFTH